MKSLIGVSLVTLMLITVVFPVSARSRRAEVSSNGSGSDNKISFFSSRMSRTSQANVFSGFSQILAKINTGNNQADENTGENFTVSTGKADTAVLVSNTGGVNYASDETCCGWGCDDPNPSPTPTPTVSPTPVPTPTPTPPSCVELAGWADNTMNVNQGTNKDDSPITDVNRTNPNATTGAVDGDFFSLGKGGFITVGFSQPVKNVEGVDLSFHEITQDRGSYPEEKMQVEVSADGLAWFNIGEVTNNDGGNGVGYLDFDSTGLEFVSYVRMTDTTDFELHQDDADGYDLDAVDATLLTCEDGDQQF